MSIQWSLELVTPPTSEPVTTAEVKDHLRVDTADDDTDIDRKIVAARLWAEEFTGRSFMATTWRLYLSDWPTAIQLPRPPLTTLTSVSYIDTAGATQTLTTEHLTNTASEPAVITEAFGESWPSLRNNQYNSVIVEYVAGYASAANVPGPIKQAIKARAASLYEFREDVLAGQAVSGLPAVAERLLWPFRTFTEVPWL